MTAYPHLKEIMFAENVLRRMTNAARLHGDEAAYAYGEATWRLKAHLLARVPEIEEAFQNGEMTGKPESVS